MEETVVTARRRRAARKRIDSAVSKLRCCIHDGTSNGFLLEFGYERKSERVGGCDFGGNMLTDELLVMLLEFGEEAKEGEMKN